MVGTWFELIAFQKDDIPNAMQSTFHIPLHRYLSVFIQHAVSYQNVSLEHILPSEEVLKQLLAHPLQLLSLSMKFFAAFGSGMAFRSRVRPWHTFSATFAIQWSIRISFSYNKWLLMWTPIGSYKQCLRGKYNSNNWIGKHCTKVPGCLCLCCVCLDFTYGSVCR